MSITVKVHFWALLDRGSRRYKAHHEAPPNVNTSISLEDKDPDPEELSEGSPRSFVAPFSYNKAIWPVGLGADGMPQELTWDFLFWAIKGVKGGTTITMEHSKQYSAQELEGATEIEAIAWYGTYGVGSGTNGVLIDAYDLVANRPIDDDFVTVKPEELKATKAANDTGSVMTDWAFPFPSCSIEAFSKIQKMLFKEWELPETPGDIKILWDDDGKQVKDVNGKPIHDPKALAVDQDKSAHLNAKKHVQGRAFAFYEIPPELQPRVKEPLLEVQVTYGVTVDGGGSGWTPHGPIPIGPWDLTTSELIMGSVLAQIADKINPELRGRLLEISEEQVSRAADAIAKRREDRSETGWLRGAAPVLWNVARVGLEVLGVAAALLVARGCGLFR